MAEKQKFPSEVIDLPSQGRLYPEDSPLRSGKIEIKYMTAKEEDILTSQNLLKKGLAIDKTINSLILTEGIKVEDLLIGDKNAIMIAARILAYGPEYSAEITDPNSGEKFTHSFNLADCEFKILPSDVDYSKNEFEIELPISKKKIKYKLLTGKEENIIERDIKATQKFGNSTEITTRLRHSIISVDGNEDRSFISSFVENLLSRDSLFFRLNIIAVSPDIDLKQEIEIGGDVVGVDIPLTTEFFWPKTFWQGRSS